MLGYSLLERACGHARSLSPSLSLCVSRHRALSLALRARSSAAQVIWNTIEQKLENLGECLNGAEQKMNVTHTVQRDANQPSILSFFSQSTQKSDKVGEQQEGGEGGEGGEDIVDLVDD